MTDFDPHLRRLMTLANRRARDEAANLATQATQASDIQLQAHTERTDNPHSVTAAQVGADATGTASAAVVAHTGASDPHGDRSFATSAVSTHTALTASVHGFGSDGSLTLPKTTGVGIKVDPATPTFGWRDIIGNLNVRGTGANDPTFAVYTGTALRAYQFSATTMMEVFFVFHIPHDYVPGTDIFLHMHWSNAAATPNTGNVRWGFDYSFAKGFDQAAFPATTTITVTQASPATRYQHMVAETAAITIPALEVDGLLLVRAYRDAANAGDTCTDAVFGHTADVHYQSSNMATKNKSPGFYS
jgi:hypothetical protein